MVRQNSIKNKNKEGNFVPALLWKRICAFLMDVLILNIFVLYPFNVIIQNSIPEIPKDSSFLDTYRLIIGSLDLEYINLIIFVMSIFIILYFIFLEKKMSQTIGKKLMKLYLVSETGDNVKIWQLIVRNIFFIPLFPFFLLWIIDPLFMFFSKNNQRLTEILSKTKVVQYADKYDNTFLDIST